MQVLEKIKNAGHDPILKAKKTDKKMQSKLTADHKKKAEIYLLLGVSAAIGIEFSSFLNYVNIMASA
jgi:hypothetical protein